MTLTDPIAQMLTTIRNGLSSNKEEVQLSSSKLKVQILEVLKKNGFVSDFKIEEEKGRQSIVVKLKYLENRPAISKIKRVSRPGQRIYMGKMNIPNVKGGRGCVILSTSSGILTDKEAKKLGVGGEALVEVW